MVARRDLNEPLPGGGKPRKLFGVTWNSRVAVFYTALFFVPPLLLIAWNGGRTGYSGMSREELLATETARQRLRQAPPAARKEQKLMAADKKAALDRVLFQTPDTDLRPEWAKRRDEKRAAAAEKAARRAEAGEEEPRR